MRCNKQVGRLHAVITLIVPRGAAASAAAACSPVNPVNITYLYLYFPLLIIMSCQLTLFLSFCSAGCVDFMYWRGNQESLQLSFLKDLFPHKGKESEQ